VKLECLFKKTYIDLYI